MRKSVPALLLLLWASSAGAMAIERVTSPGGIEAWLVEDHALPVVAIRFAFPGGAALDPPGKGGLAAMTISLLDEGAGPYDTVAFKTRLEDLVADSGFTASRDEVGGSLRSLKANLSEAAGLLRAALTSPRFEPAASTECAANSSRRSPSRRTAHVRSPADCGCAMPSRITPTARTSMGR